MMRGVSYNVGEFEDNNEALKMLISMLNERRQAKGESKEDKYYGDILIEAIFKQIGADPIIGDEDCPCCGEPMNAHYAYCPICGQRLLWKDTDKESSYDCKKVLGPVELY